MSAIIRNVPFSGIADALTNRQLACTTIARAVLMLLSVCAAARPIAAQELEPRAYSASPVGATFLLASISRSSGNVVTDRMLPIDDMEATRHIAMAAMGYTFGLFGDVGLLTAVVPYASVDVSGRVLGQVRTVTRSGMADSRFKLSVNLRGNPAMGARAFAAAPRRTILGASVMVVAPTGEYDSTKLINVGNRRWAVKPEAGLSIPLGHWDLDAYGGVWLFSANDDFYPSGLTRTQDGLFTLQGHVSYTFRPRFWLGANATWYTGGAATVGERARALRMNNSRMGLTISLPAGDQQSIKVAYSAGMSVRAGPNFNTVSVAWQRFWLTKP